MNDVLGMLWSPLRTIKLRMKQPIALATPAAVFLGALALFVLDMTLMYGAIIGTLPEGSELGMANLGFGLNLAFFAINMLLFWVIGSGILACLAILLDGEGEYRRVLELTGLAHLPSLIFGVLGLGIALTYQPRLRLDELATRHAPGTKLTADQRARWQEDLRAEVRQETQRRSFLLITACRYTFQAWTLVLCVIAVKECFKLDYVKAGMSVAGLVLLYVILEVARTRIIAGGGGPGGP